MGKFSGILICTDLDGTLFRDDKTISEENKAASEYFMREGGYFTFVTGRMPCYATSAYEAVGPNAPFGCINGGGLYDGERGEYVWSCTLTDEITEIVDVIEKEFPDVGIHPCCLDKLYCTTDNRVTRAFRRITGLPKIECAYRDIPTPVAQIILGIDSEEVIEEVTRTLKGHPLFPLYDVIRSEETLLQIQPKGINKGNSIIKLSEHLGISRGKTIAVGDYDNDVGMLRAAKLGIAVANASPAAKAAADLVTVSNEQHAIAQIIHDIENGKITI